LTTIHEWPWRMLGLPRLNARAACGDAHVQPAINVKRLMRLLVRRMYDGAMNEEKNTGLRNFLASR